jgi:hypothetical protein
MVSKLLVATVAGVVGFALGGAFWLSLGIVEGWPFEAMLLAVPAALIALMPATARAFCLVLGILALLGVSLMDISGPDNPLLLLPWAALSFIVGVIVADLCVRANQRFSRSRYGDSEVPDQGI